ncbi:hypothetical protein N6H14_14595 [Paenibacillus sp. CC-CFT747]|nr:hypothetical protein N6H14_14595 [Paenibacillus sp. CC-CFT747]
MAKTEYRINGGAWSLFSGPVALTENGIYTVEYRSTDVAGNQEAVKTAGFKLDKTVKPPADTVAPVTKYHFDPIYAVSSKGVRYVKGYNVSLRATDNTGGSGVKSTQYRINGGAWKAYTGTFVIYAGETHTVEYFSTDLAGNTESPMNKMDFDRGTFTGAGAY